MSNILDTINYPEDLKGLTFDELQSLCQELRDFLVEHVYQTGGHLGSNLGVVELTVALHYVFHAPYDKIIWDIGHQAYIHKILTGRKRQISTIRQSGGLSGFSNPFESVYDEFIGGHSSTAISSGIGSKVAFDMLGEEDRVVISVIGDAAISAGMAFEALNHLGDLKSGNIVILNDNSMSISKTKGALSNYLSKTRTSSLFLEVKDVGKNLVGKFNKPFYDLADSLKKNLTKMIEGDYFFNQLGIKYIGPIDGHNIRSLIDIFNNIKTNVTDTPIILHIVTKKGKGYQAAELAGDALHAVEARGVVQSPTVTNRSVCIDHLIKLASEDKRVVAITPAMVQGSGLMKFKDLYPKQVFDVGIAEQHSVTFSAGLARAGMKPFVMLYSCFAQRAYGQVVHDVVIPKLPVRFVLDRAGLNGADGPTHFGILDYSMYLPLPNIFFFAPSCKEEIPGMISLMFNIDDAPSFIRYSKDNHPDITDFNVKSVSSKIVVGKGHILQKSDEICNIAILSIGEILFEVLRANEKLLLEGIKITIADIRFLKPIDEKLISLLAKNHKSLIIVEEGFGNIFAMEVVRVLNNHKLNNLDLEFLSIPDIYMTQGSSFEQKIEAGIDNCSIYKLVKNKVSELSE